MKFEDFRGKNCAFMKAIARNWAFKKSAEKKKKKNLGRVAKD